MRTLEELLIKKVNNKTKPIGSLGKLEKLALQIGLIQNTVSPKLTNPQIVVFAGDHGIVESGVSAYPQAVTAQMVLNFTNGGAAINVFTKLNDLGLTIVDAGVNYDFEGKLKTKEKNLKFVDAKIAKGTKNFLVEPAMDEKQLEQAISSGREVIKNLIKTDCNIVGFGEIGIGNTSASAVLAHKILKIPMEKCVGKGAGLDDQQLQHKINTLKQADHKYSQVEDPLELIRIFGGFEHAMLVGAILEAKDQGMVIMVGGYIVTSAFLVAHKINREILENCIFTHLAAEIGHREMLEYLDAEPVLELGLRLGEGTGSALAYPIIKSAVAFLNEMQSFNSAGVSKKS